jgi:NADH/NAD ratio-sensing transcriptional regulator Rex
MRDGSGETEEQAEMAEEARRAERLREREMADLRDRVKDLEVELQIAAAKNDEANKVVEQMAKLSVQGG